MASEQNVSGNVPVTEVPAVAAAQQNGNGNAAPKVNTAAPKVNTAAPVSKWLSMLGVILAESGVGFGVGFTLGRNNVAGATLSIIAMSVVFGLEFWTRYNVGSSLPLFFGGLLALIAAGLVPYLAMSRAPKSKGKSASVYLPTVAASWSFTAILFGLVCAMMSGGKVLKSDALQGVILSLLYAGVTSAAGYSVGTPGGAKSGNTVFAMMAWGALVMFDLAGLARGP